MASSLISGAIALLLILSGGYIIASGILTIAESTMNSQKEMANIEENLMQTKISGLYANVSGSGPYVLTFGIANNGSTTFGIPDFNHSDLFIYDSSGMNRYLNPTGANKWAYSLVNDRINSGMWDSSEIINISIILTSEPHWVKFVTPNGISAATNL